jgi:hypothetical protein
VIDGKGNLQDFASCVSHPFTDSSWPWNLELERGARISSPVGSIDRSFGCEFHRKPESGAETDFCKFIADECGAAAIEFAPASSIITRRPRRRHRRRRPALSRRRRLGTKMRPA